MCPFQMEYMITRLEFRLDSCCILRTLGAQGPWIEPLENILNQVSPLLEPILRL